jgi:hypothetical protein
MLRTSKKMGEETLEASTQDQAGAVMDALAHRKSGARRTAWIIGAIAIAFFIASLVQGHLFHIPG